MPRGRQFGHIVSEETREKIRQSLLKTYEEKPELKTNSGQFSKGKIAWNKGIPATEEMAIKLRTARIGLPSANKEKAMSGEQKLKISNSKKGIKPNYPNNELRLQRISEAKKKHVETSVGCLCAACKVPTSPTVIENILVDILLREFPCVEKYKKFGRYEVDAYLPKYHLAFEADGERWHQNKDRDIKRDAFLLENFSLPVIRFTGKELVAMKKAYISTP